MIILMSLILITLTVRVIVNGYRRCNPKIIKISGTDYGCPDPPAAP